MQITTSLTALGLIALSPTADSPRWAPESGATLTKEFVTTSDITLDSMSVRMAGGEEVDRAGVQVVTRSSHTVAFVDSYTSDDKRSPSTIKREFTKISKMLDAEVRTGESNHDYSTTVEHELSGHTVVASRTDDAWSVAFADGDEGEADWLEGLVGEADLAGLLPLETIEPGTSWDVEPEALLGLLRPAGAPTAWPTEMKDNADAEGMTFCPLLCLREAAGTIEGKVRATWTETNNEDGRRIAEISLTVEITAQREVLGDLTALIQALETGQVLPQFSTADVSLDWEAEGTLRWDLDAGLPQSLALTGPVAAKFAMGAEMNGSQIDVEMELSGTSSAALTTSR